MFKWLFTAIIGLFSISIYGQEQYIGGYMGYGIFKDDDVRLRVLAPESIHKKDEAYRKLDVETGLSYAIRNKKENFWLFDVGVRYFTQDIDNIEYSSNIMKLQELEAEEKMVFLNVSVSYLLSTSLNDKFELRYGYGQMLSTNVFYSKKHTSVYKDEILGLYHHVKRDFKLKENDFEWNNFLDIQFVYQPKKRITYILSFKNLITTEVNGAIAYSEIKYDINGHQTSGEFPLSSKNVIHHFKQIIQCKVLIKL